MTLLELILACSILVVLSSAALPIVRYTIVHKREAELHYDLRQIRDAIDRYKDLADRNLIRVEVGTEGYPPDLETLVKGVQLGAGNDRKIRFLRRIPKDPMTQQKDWHLDFGDTVMSPDQTTTGIVDVHSNSSGTGSNGTLYNTW